MKQDVSQIVPLVLLLVLISWPLSLVRVLLFLAYVSCFWLLCALRGNASADNYFFLSTASLSILLHCLCIAKF